MARKRKSEEKAQKEAPAAKRPATEKREAQTQNTEQHHGFEPYPPSKVYRLIEPGPVLLVTTGSLSDATHNVMTIGFHMVIQHESPPLIGISLGPWDASFTALKKRRECVLAVPAVEMAATVVDIGNCSADDEDLAEPEGSGGKWARFGLDAVLAGKVKAPLVGGPHVIANIECVVEDTKMVSKYSMWVLKPVKAWINPQQWPGSGGQGVGKMFHHRGDGTFVVDGEILDLKDRMVKWQEFQG